MIKAFLRLLFELTKKTVIFLALNRKRNVCAWNTIIRGNVQIGDRSFIDEDSQVTTEGKNCHILIGEDCNIGKRFLSAAYGENLLKIGDKVGINNNVVLFGDIRIGSYSKFAFNIYISSGKHFFDLHPTWLINDQDLEASRSSEFVGNFNSIVDIHEDVWVGNGVVIMPGITIGRGAVIGSNSVVTENVLPYTVVGGIPAKYLKSRLDFRPPLCISSLKEEDLPYFYEGFYHEKGVRDAFPENMFAKEKSAIVLTKNGKVLYLRMGGMKGFLKNSVSVFMNGTELSKIVLEHEGVNEYRVELPYRDDLDHQPKFNRFEFYSKRLSRIPNHENLKYSFVLKEAFIK